MSLSGASVPDGDEGGQDAGDHRGLLHLLLVPLLHHVPRHRLLRGVRPPARILRHLLARLLQLRHQPIHLRRLLQGLPVGGQFIIPTNSQCGSLFLPKKS